MIFLTLIIVFSLEFTPLVRYRKTFHNCLHWYFNYLSGEVAWLRHKGALILWGISTGTPVAITIVVTLALSSINPILGFIVGVIVVFLVSSFLLNHNQLKATSSLFEHPISEDVQEKISTLTKEETDGLDQVGLISLVFQDHLYRVFHQVFVVIFFLVLLGPSAAVGYFVSLEFLRKNREDKVFGEGNMDFLMTVHQIVEWIPERIFAFSLAIAGNFEDALQSWREYTENTTYGGSQKLFIMSAAGALGVRLVGVSASYDNEKKIKNFVGVGSNPDSQTLLRLGHLISRVLFIWIGLIGGFAIFSVFG